MTDQKISPLTSKGPALGRVSFFFVLASALLIGGATFSPTEIQAAEQKVSPPDATTKKAPKKTFRKKKSSRKSFVDKRKKKRTTRKKPPPKKYAYGTKGFQTKAVIESTRRDVNFKKAGAKNWTKANRRTKLNANDIIKTGKKSLARVKLEDGSKILLLQNSEAELENLSTFQKTIKLMRGRVRAVVSKLKRAKAFRVKTPIGVASVRGTDFEVGFEAESQSMEIKVKEGQVGVSRLTEAGLDSEVTEVLLNAGDSIKFNAEGAIGNPIQTGFIPLNRTDVRNEVQITSVKNSIIAQAAIESRNADYQVGKSVIDPFGRRVRVEEYIMRPAPEQFKLVVLNDRPTRFDWFTYTGTFNKALPDDLSIPLSQIKGKLNEEPEYILRSYESFSSNTKDTVTDSGSGGHLVKIEFDGDKYTLTDIEDGNLTEREIDAATLQDDGTYKIYNPITDKFSYSTAETLAEAQKVSILDSGSYRNLTSDDVYYKGRFNETSFKINGIEKIGFTNNQTYNILSADLDGTWSNSPVTTITEFPSGTGNLHTRLTYVFADGKEVQYDTYIHDDEGDVAATSVFSGISTSAGYQNELLNWNYTQKVTADEMEGRSIDLTIAPKIGTMSGLIE